MTAIMNASRYISMLSDECISCLIEQHRQNVASGKPLRNLSKRQVSIVEHEGIKYIVKAYRLNIIQRILGIVPDRTSGALLLKGFTPLPLANITKDGWQYTIYNYAGNHDMFDQKWLIQQETEKVVLFFRKSADIMQEIHANGLFHGDMKSPNFVINEYCRELPPVVVIDCDKVKQYAELPEDKRLFNIAQFVACHGYKTGPDKRLPLFLKAFLDEYCAKSLYEEKQFNQIKHQVLDIIKNDRHIELHTPQNILEEVLLKS